MGVWGRERRYVECFSPASKKIIELLWTKEMSYFSQNIMSEGVGFVPSESGLMPL